MFTKIFSSYVQRFISYRVHTKKLSWKQYRRQKWKTELL